MKLGGMMATNKQAASNLQAVVHLEGLKQTKGGFEISTDCVRRLEIPAEVTQLDIQRAQRDCEILGAMLRNNSKEALELISAIQRGKLDDAKRVARKIGLTEPEFSEQGGGLMWLVVIGVLLYATDAF
jgi:hypothetical protein